MALVLVAPAWAGSAQNIITRNPGFDTRDGTGTFQQPRYWRCKWPGDTTNNWWWTITSTDHYADAAGLCSWGCDQDGKLAIRMIRDENLLICQDGTNFNTLNEGTMTRLYADGGRTRLVCRVWRKTCRNNVFFGWIERQNQWYSQGGSEAVRLRQLGELNDDEAEGVLEYREFTKDWTKWVGGAVGVRGGGYVSSSQLTMFDDYFLAFEVAGALKSSDLPTEFWAGDPPVQSQITLESWGIEDFSVRTEDWRMRTSNDDANKVLLNTTGELDADCYTSMSSTGEEITFGCTVHAYGEPAGDADQNYNVQVYFRRINTDEVDLVKWDTNPDNRQCRMKLPFPVKVKGHEPLVQELTAGWRDHNTVRLSFIGHDRRGDTVTYTALQYRIGETGTWTAADCDPPTSSEFTADNPVITLDWNVFRQLVGAEHDDAFFRIEVSDGVYTSESQVGPFVVSFTDTHPTVVITHPDSPTRISPIPFTITFSEPVAELLADELLVTGGTITDFSGSGAVYEVQVTPDGDGEVTLQVPADVAEDIGGDGNATSEPASLIYDSVAPGPTLTYTGAGTIAGGNITLGITLNEPVVDLTVASIEVTNGTRGILTGSGLSCSIQITPIRDGLITCQIPADVLHDAAGNSNPASNMISVIRDTGPPGVTVAHAGHEVTNATEITFTITFTELVEDLVPTWLHLTNCTRVGFTGTGDTYSVVVVPTAPGTVSCMVPAGVTQDVAGQRNTESNLGSTTYTTDPSPFVLAFSSVRNHAEQEQSIALDPSKAADGTGADAPTVEPRLGGVKLIQVRFDMAVVPTDGTLSANDVVVRNSAGTAVAADSLSIATEEPMLSISFDPPLPDAECYTIELAGKFKNAVGLLLAGDTDCAVRCLAGDVNGDGEVTALDLELVKQANRRPFTPADVRYDVNCDALLDMIDAAVIRKHISE